MGRPRLSRPSPPRQRADDGRWYSTFNGEVIYLAGSGASRVEVEAAYAKLVQRAAANPEYGRRLRADATFGELIDLFLRSDESPRSERQQQRFLQIGELFEECFEDVPAAGDFDADDFREFKEWMKGSRFQGRERWSRGVINSTLGMVKRLVRFGRSRRLCRADFAGEIGDVKGVRVGDGRENPPVTPAAWPDIRLALPKMPAMVRAMAIVQIHSGARAGELVTLKPVDIERAGKTWIYRPGKHKSAWRGRPRVIMFGRKAQAALRPLLADCPPDGFVFSPARGEAKRLELARARRKTPVWPSHQERYDRQRKGEDAAVRPGERYTTASYRRALERACEAAGVPKFTPHRLRHRFITDARAHPELGLESARAAAGHSVRSMTERYSGDVDLKLADKVAALIG